MIWKNIELYNVAETVDHGDGVTWRRMPGEVCATLEKDTENYVVTNATGVELRFIIRGDEARICMASVDDPVGGFVCTFHVFYGSVQGGWQDHETHKLIGNEPTEFVFKRHGEMDALERISRESGYPFDPTVVRVIFDRGHIKLMDVVGDVEPPHRAQTPQSTLLCYGSSITHGSNAIDMSHAWASVTAHRLGMDCRNLGMAGTCAMEPAVIDYIAAEGMAGRWDAATMELGINVLDWAEEKIYERVTYAIKTVASKNPDKHIFVISPFYSDDDFFARGRAARWREIIAEVVEGLHHPNVHYRSGLDFIDSMDGICADLVHPNIYGIQHLTEKLLLWINSVRSDI